jgi:hypothetical protein
MRENDEQNIGPTEIQETVSSETEMRTYVVTWEIELDAVSPRAAAQQALAIHRDASSLATCFAVVEAGSGELLKVDLEVEDEEEQTDDSPD